MCTAHTLQNEAWLLLGGSQPALGHPRPDPALKPTRGTFVACTPLPYMPRSPGALGRKSKLGLGAVVSRPAASSGRAGVKEPAPAPTQKPGDGRVPHQFTIKTLSFPINPRISGAVMVMGHPEHPRNGAVTANRNHSTSWADTLPLHHPRRWTKSAGGHVPQARAPKELSLPEGQQVGRGLHWTLSRSLGRSPMLQLML